MDISKGCIIAYKSLSAGSFEYDFTLDNEFFRAFEGSEVTGGDCHAQVLLKRGATTLDLDVKIEGDVIVACDRCLEDCPVAIDFEGRLIVKFSAEVGEYDGEILWLSPAESEVDLSQYIYESVVLSLPYQRVHPEGECNEEMIRKFATISGEQLEELELRAQGADEDTDSAEEGAEEAEMHGLAAEDMAKLAALRKLMSGEEEE